MLHAPIPAAEAASLPLGSSTPPAASILAAAERILALTEGLTEDDLVLCLISAVVFWRMPETSDRGRTPAA